MRHRSRIMLEQLENRWCPAVTASLNLGKLTVSGFADNGSINVVQDSTTAGKIQILDGAIPVAGSPFTSVKHIQVLLTGANDVVNVDLGGKTFHGVVNVKLGNGANSLSVVNGELSTQISVSSGNDADTVTFGDGAKALSIRDVSLVLGEGVDTVNHKASSSIERFLNMYYVNNVTMDSGAVARDAWINGGSGGNAFNFAGDVTGNLFVDAFYFTNGASDSASFNMTGVVNGNLFYSGSKIADNVSITGPVLGDVDILTWGGNDTVSLSDDIQDDLVLDAGDGNDQITLSGSVGGNAHFYAGTGTDALTLTDTAVLHDSSHILMGTGQDTVTIDDFASYTKLFASGGSGIDVFIGDDTNPDLLLSSF